MEGRTTVVRHGFPMRRSEAPAPRFDSGNQDDNMKTARSVSIVTLALALAGGLVSGPAAAEVPKAPVKISVMDANKNGRIEKEEYVAYMTKAFDEAAGAKGYCTFEEVAAGFRRFEITANP